ncbi:unnamed protein product, partial [marine sediment metagenome]
MSYRNPRFSYVHTLRDFGDANFGVATNAYRTDAPRTRLLDDQSKVFAGQQDVLQATQFHRETGVTIPGSNPVTRFILPAHNFALDRMVQFREATDFGSLNWALVKLSDGTTPIVYIVSSGIFDLEWDAPVQQFVEAMEFLHRASFSGDDPDMGE